MKNERECGERRGSGYCTKQMSDAGSQLKPSLFYALDAYPPAKREEMRIEMCSEWRPSPAGSKKNRERLNEVWRVNLNKVIIPTLAVLPIFRTPDFSQRP